MLLTLSALSYMANSSWGDQPWGLFPYLNESIRMVQVNPNEQGINTVHKYKLCFLIPQFSFSVLATLLKSGMYVPQLHSSDLPEDVSEECKEVPFFLRDSCLTLSPLGLFTYPRECTLYPKKMLHVELIHEEGRINTTTKTAFIASIKIAVIISSKHLVETESSFCCIHNWSLFVFPRIIW